MIEASIPALTNLSFIEVSVSELRSMASIPFSLIMISPFAEVWVVLRPRRVLTGVVLLVKASLLSAPMI